MKVENNLDTDKVRGLVWRLAFPSMLAQFVNVMYSIVDRMYIGNIPEIGALALAGVGICGPVVTLISSFASWIGVGGAPLMSIRLGQKNERAAAQMVANCFALLTGMALIIMIVSYLFKDQLLVFFGAGPAIFPYANQYMSWYLTGTAFALISAGMNQFIICQGFATVGMKSVVLGAVSNIVLDPVFIFVMNMGVRGAAIATVLSQMASCIYVLLILFGKRPLVRITFGGYRWKTMKQVLLVGLSPFLIIASDSLLIIVMNMVISSYGGPERSDMLLTCNTIVQSFMLIITMPLGGITGGTQTVMGYNYGAGRPDRIRKAEKHILLLSVAFTTVMFIIAQAGPGYFVRIFTREMSYVRVTEWAIRIFTLCIIPLAVEYTVVDGFTGMGIAKVAISLSMFRKSVYFLGMILLPRYFGVEAVFYAEPISDIMACAAASTTFIMKGAEGQSQAVLMGRFADSRTETYINGRKRNMNILVSACLLGVECRYDGRGVLMSQAEELLSRHHLIPVCPEIMGGLATPRTPAERTGSGVVTRDGEDVTAAYEKGAWEVLKLAQLYGCQAAILKERSPSCGSGQVYDGTFTGTLTKGDGVCAACLKEHGIRVYGESQVGRLLEDIER